MPLYIGDNPNVRLNFNGIIDDVRVYTRALTVNEMKTIYYGAGRDNIVNGLYANWKLREKHFGSRFSLPNTLIDYSSFKKHAISEDAGYALSFDGVNDVVGLACVNTDFQLVAPFTIEAWVKPMFNYACWAASTAYSVGDKRVYSGIPYRCTLNHTSQVGWEPPNAPALWALEEAFLFGTNYLDGNGVSFGRKGRKLALLVNGQRWYESTGDLTSGTWSHVSVVFQDYCCGGKQSLFYINGCLIDTVCDAYAANPGITLNLAQIGARGDSACYWYGSIDQVKMYKGEARSAANISLYKDEHPPNNSNLKGYWKLNDASGTSAADVSGNSHTGTISGAVWEESSAWAIPLCDNILSHRRT